MDGEPHLHRMVVAVSTALDNVGSGGVVAAVSAKGWGLARQAAEKAAALVSALPKNGAM